MNSVNLYQYLNAVWRLWNNFDGSGVSKFLSLNGNHIKNRNLQLENPESSIERVMEPPLAEVISCHLKVLFYLNESRKLILSHLFKFIDFISNFSSKSNRSVQTSNDMRAVCSEAPAGNQRRKLVPSHHVCNMPRSSIARSQM